MLIQSTSLYTMTIDNNHIYWNKKLNVPMGRQIFIGSYFLADGKEIVYSEEDYIPRLRDDSFYLDRIKSDDYKQIYNNVIKELDNDKQFLETIIQDEPDYTILAIALGGSCGRKLGSWTSDLDIVVITTGPTREGRGFMHLPSQIRGHYDFVNIDDYSDYSKYKDLFFVDGVIENYYLNHFLYINPTYKQKIAALQNPLRTQISAACFGLYLCHKQIIKDIVKTNSMQLQHYRKTLYHIISALDIYYNRTPDLDYIFYIKTLKLTCPIVLNQQYLRRFINDLNLFLHIINTIDENLKSQILGMPK